MAHSRVRFRLLARLLALCRCRLERRRVLTIVDCHWLRLLRHAPAGLSQLQQPLHRVGSGAAAALLQLSAGQHGGIHGCQLPPGSGAAARHCCRRALELRACGQQEACRQEGRECGGH